VPDESLTIDEGAVAPWGSLMWSLMKDIAREMGVRTDVPFKDLSDKEKEIVYHGPAQKRHIIYKNEKTNGFAEMDFTYYSAVYSVENALAKVKDEKGMKRVEIFVCFAQKLDVYSVMPMFSYSGRITGGRAALIPSKLKSHQKRWLLCYL
jgi:excinuclease UvrABC ATPase subunit